MKVFINEEKVQIFFKHNFKKILVVYDLELPLRSFTGVGLIKLAKLSITLKLLFLHVIQIYLNIIKKLRNLD